MKDDVILNYYIMLNHRITSIFHCSSSMLYASWDKTPTFPPWLLLCHSKSLTFKHESSGMVQTPPASVLYCTPPSPWLNTWGHAVRFHQERTCIPWTSAHPQPTYPLISASSPLQIVSSASSQAPQSDRSRSDCFSSRCNVHHECIHTAIHECIYSVIHECIHTVIHECIYTVIHECIHTVIHECIHTVIHECIYSVIHECIYTVIHECIYTVIHECIYTVIHECKYTVIHECIYSVIHECIYTVIHECIYTVTHECIYSVIHECIYTVIHECIYTVIHECIYTVIHKCIHSSTTEQPA
jgi:hypothetical protein